MFRCNLKKIIISILGILLNIPFMAAEASTSLYSILDSEILIGSESAENLARKEMYERIVNTLPPNQILQVNGESGEVTRAIRSFLPDALKTPSMGQMAESNGGYKPVGLDDDSIRFVFEYMQFGFAKIKLGNMNRAVEILHYAHQVMASDLIIDLMTTVKDLPIAPFSDEVVASLALHFVNHFDTYTGEAQKIIKRAVKPRHSCRGYKALPHVGVCWFSMYFLIMLSGAPPQLPAK